jgi:hypothetical protein
VDARPRTAIPAGDNGRCGYQPLQPGYLVYRYNERKAGQRNQSVRMLAHLVDLGAEAAVPNTTAKKMVLQEAGGDVARAQEAWVAAGLPGTGPVTAEQLEQARAAAREAGNG